MYFGHVQYLFSAGNTQKKPLLKKKKNFIARHLFKLKHWACVRSVAGTMCFARSSEMCKKETSLSIKAAPFIHFPENAQSFETSFHIRLRLQLFCSANQKNGPLVTYIWIFLFTSPQVFFKIFFRQLKLHTSHWIYIYIFFSESALFHFPVKIPHRDVSGTQHDYTSII